MNMSQKVFYLKFVFNLETFLQGTLEVILFMSLHLQTGKVFITDQNFDNLIIPLGI